MYLFTAFAFEGTPAAGDGGVLGWVPKGTLEDLNIWEGHKRCFRLLTDEVPFFSLKLVYDGGGGLVSAALNGTAMKL